MHYNFRDGGSKSRQRREQVELDEWKVSPFVYIQGQTVGKMVVSSDQNSFFTFPLKAQPRGLFKTRKKRCFLKTVAVEKDVLLRQHLWLL